MMSNFKKLSLVAAVTLALSACSEEAEEVAPVTDAPPVLSLETTSASIDEGEVITISFNTDDDGGTPKLSIQESDLRGDVTLGSNMIRYTAPWLSEDDTITETFTVLATDSAGQNTTRDVTITVSDRNEPVSVRVTPPSQARGFENTKTDTLLNFWVDEGQENLTLSYELQESDADVLNISYELGDESFIFWNNIDASQTTSGDTTRVELSFAIPRISDTNSTTSTPSQDVSLTLNVDDGDDVVSAVVNMTVVNVVRLGWEAGNPARISETDGGVLTYTSSESQDYPGDYSVLLFDENGEELDFDLPYTLDTQARTITFGQSEDIAGNQNVEVVIRHINTVSNAAGESYDPVFTASRMVTIVDDRDEGFLSYEQEYETNLGLFADVRTRRDEDRVASAASSYLFLNGWIDEVESESFETQVSALLDEETQVLTGLADDIDDALNAGKQGQEVQDLMDDFSENLYAFGYSAREFMLEKMEEYEAIESNADKTLGLGHLSAARTGSLFDDGRITHYVGNSIYGRYESDDTWVFDASYGYLAVADITDSYCF